MVVEVTEALVNDHTPASPDSQSASAISVTSFGPPTLLLRETLGRTPSSAAPPSSSSSSSASSEGSSGWRSWAAEGEEDEDGEEDNGDEEEETETL